MALRAIIGADELEGIPEGIREHYKKLDDGTHVLDVTADKGYELANTGNLKTSLSQERARADKAENALRKFDDIDPDKAKEAIRKMAEFATINPEKEADRLANEKVEAIKTQLVEQHSNEVSGLKSTIASQDKELDKLTRQNDIQRAFEKHGGNTTLLMPHALNRTRSILSDNGQRRIEVLDDAGNARLNSDGSFMAVDALVAEMKASDDFSAGFAGTGNTGSGSPPGKTNTPAGTAPAVNKRAQDMTTDEKSAYIAEHGQDKWTEKVSEDYSNPPPRAAPATP